MNEKLDYVGVQNTIYKLEKIAARMTEILNEATSDMKNVNTSEYWSSPAAKLTVDTFLESASKFEKFPREVLSYANYLRTILEQYSHMTSTASTKLSGTTDKYIGEIK